MTRFFQSVSFYSVGPVLLLLGLDKATKFEYNLKGSDANYAIIWIVNHDMTISGRDIFSIQNHSHRPHLKPYRLHIYCQWNSIYICILSVGTQVTWVNLSYTMGIISIFCMTTVWLHCRLINTEFPQADLVQRGFLIQTEDPRTERSMLFRRITV